MTDIDAEPTPQGDLAMQLLAHPKDTNAFGDVYAGWLLEHMDLAGAISARELALGRITTVASGNMVFLRPVPVGSTVSCYTEIVDKGRSSIKVMVEVWAHRYDRSLKQKVTEGEFVYVAIDDSGRTRPLPND